MKTKLRGITWKNPRGYDPLRAASAQYTELYPDVEVVWDQMNWYQFEETVISSLSGKSTPRYDLVMFDHPWTGTLVARGWLVPWNELLTENYLTDLSRRVVPPSVESYAWRGKLYGLPLDAACHAGVVRSDLVDMGEIPEDWEGIIEWAKAYRSRRTPYPLVLCVSGVQGSCLFLSMMAALGSPAFESPEPGDYDRDNAGYVLEVLQQLTDLAPPGSVRWQPWDVYNQLCSSDQVGFSPAIFAYVNYFSGSSKAERLRIGDVPVFASRKERRAILGGVGIGVSHFCETPDVASNYCVYLMSDPVQEELFVPNSGQPAVSTVWENPQVNERWNNFYSDLSRNMASAYIRPRYEDFHARELAVGRALQQLWDKQSTVQAVLGVLDTL